MLTQLRNRVKELEDLAGEVAGLAKRFGGGEDVQPEFAIKGQQWYRGARELLAQQKASGLKDFDRCYDCGSPVLTDIHDFLNLDRRYCSRTHLFDSYGTFDRLFVEARAIVLALESEILSRELPVKTELSFEVVTSEMDAAEQLLSSAKSEEVFVRAAGVIARVALERHLFTVADARSISITKNPPTKPVPTVEDAIQSLQKAGIINAIQRSQLDSLFKVANHCAHPKEPVQVNDVERLIREGTQLTALIV